MTPFAARFCDVAKRLDLWVDSGPLEGWVPLDRLATERFDIAEAYLDAWQAFYPGLDRRGGAAFLVGSVAYYVTAAMVATHITEGAIPDLGAIAVSLSGKELRYRLPDDVVGRPSEPLEMALRLETLITPLIARLKDETCFGYAAAWRCVADNFASAHLYIGRSLGAEAQARLEALSVFSQPGLRMVNRQTGYRDVTIRCDDGREVTQGFLKRGGCCRYYTADDGEYCTTCVLRSDQDQVTRLETYLREAHDMAAAAE